MSVTVQHYLNSIHCAPPGVSRARRIVMTMLCAVALGVFGSARAEAGKSVSFRAVDEPGRITVDMPTSLLAYDLCWSDDTAAARQRLADAIVAGMTTGGALQVVELPQLPPVWSPIGAGDLRDLQGRPINRLRVARGKSGYEASVEEALLDVLERVRELRPTTRFSVVGFETRRQRDGMTQFARLAAASDFVFMDADLATRIRRADRRRDLQWQIDSQRVWLERSGMSERRIVVLRHTDQWIAASLAPLPEILNSDEINPEPAPSDSPGRSTEPPTPLDDRDSPRVETTTPDEGPQRATAAKSPDLNGDGRVDSSDKALLISRWGTNDFAADLDSDGTVGATDLAMMLGMWTRDPAPELPVGEFAPAPAQYTHGSQMDIMFNIAANAPAGGSVVFQVWSQDSGTAQAVYTDSQAPFMYPWQMLEQASVGQAQIQARVRDSANNVLATFAHDVTFVSSSSLPPPPGESTSSPVAVLTLHDAAGPRQAPHTVNVDGLASDFRGEDWRTMKFEWDFGDATAPTWLNDPRTGVPVNLNTGQRGFNASYVYQQPGLYTVKLKVTNAAGRTSTAVTTVTVLPSPYGPFDANGWITFTQSPDARVIYVSRSGSDGNSGLSPGAPVATIAKAYSLARDGYPDWVLFKRGDFWTEAWPSSWSKSGRSRTERALVSAYGEGPRPKFERGFFLGSAFRKHMAIVGLEFEAPLQGATQSAGITILCGGQDFIIEDCKVSRFQNGVYVSSPDMEHVQIRRNVVHNNYSRVGGHSQGLLVGDFRGLLLEENIFHGNGHKGDRSDATMFNHNLYLAGGLRNIIVRRNIITDASSHGISCNADALIEDNVVARNAIGIFARTAPTTVRGNVVMEGVDINPSMGRGFGIIIGDQWYNIGGVAVVENNIVGQNITTVGHPAIQLGTRSNGSPAMSATFRYNIVRGWGGSSFEVQGGDLGHYNQIRTKSNLFDEGGAQSLMVRFSPPSFDASRYFTCEENGYRSARPASSWFMIGSANKSFQQWAAAAHETDAAQWTGQFVDPSRTLATYHSSMGRTNSFQAFMNEAIKQSRNNWRNEYTAPAIINYIRAGYAPR